MTLLRCSSFQLTCSGTPHQLFHCLSWVGQHIACASDLSAVLCAQIDELAQVGLHFLDQQRQEFLLTLDRWEGACLVMLWTWC